MEAWPYYRPEARGKLFWHLVDRDDPADVQRLRDLYDACILHTDGQLGRVLDALEARGLLDETLVVFTSDHGEEFAEHGGFTHDTQYQELLHVPLVVRPPATLLPEVPRPLRVGGVARSVDVLPTVLEMLELPRPEGLAGRSLVPSLRGGRIDHEPLVFSQWPRGNYHALRVGRWKYIHKIAHFDETVLDDPVDVELLFDLEEDPGETRDLSAERPALVATMRARMEALRAAGRARRAELGPGQTVELDEDTRMLLEGLGYLGR